MRTPKTKIAALATVILLGISTLITLVALYLASSQPTPVPPITIASPSPDSPASAPAPPTLRNFPGTLSKETTGITSPLRSNGAPDYIAALNAQYSQGITPENNGFVLYLPTVRIATNHPEIIGRYYQLSGTPPPPTDQPTSLGFNQALTAKHVSITPARKLMIDFLTLQSTLWQAKDHPDAAAYLQDQQKILDILVEASKKSRWWTPVISPNNTLSQADMGGGSPYPADDVVNLGTRATLRAAAGDFDGFLSDVLAAKRLARFMAAEPTGSEQAIAGYDEGVADNAIGAFTGSGKLSTDQVQKIQQELAALPPLPSPIAVLDTTERWQMLDAFITISTHELVPPIDDPRWAAPPPDPLTFIDADAVDWDSTLKQANQAWDENLAAVRASTWHQDLALSVKSRTAWPPLDDLNQDPTALKPHPNESREDYTARITRGILTYHLGIPDNADRHHRTALQQNEMLNALLVAALIKARTGHWPEKLVALPLDQFSIGSSSPCHYVIILDRARIYSVSLDGQDNAGGPGDLCIGEPNTDLLP